MLAALASSAMGRSASVPISAYKWFNPSEGRNAHAFRHGAMVSRAAPRARSAFIGRLAERLRRPATVASANPIVHKANARGCSRSASETPVLDARPSSLESLRLSARQCALVVSLFRWPKDRCSGVQRHIFVPISGFSSVSVTCPYLGTRSEEPRHDGIASLDWRGLCALCVLRGDILRSDRRRSDERRLYRRRGTLVRSL